MWDDLRFNVTNFIEGIFSISIKINVPNGLPNSAWWLSAIYGPAKRRNINNFLLELTDLNSMCSPNWHLAGDFNIVRYSAETSTQNSSTYSMRKFNTFITASSLIDPPLTNSKYTWSNLRVQPVPFRIDRFLYTTGWENLFSLHYSKALSRITSDHFPLLLESSNISWGPPPFRFINQHLKENWFKHNIGTWWKNLRQIGHPRFSFMQKLKNLSFTMKAEYKKKKKQKKKKINEEDKRAWIKEIDEIDKLKAESQISEAQSRRRTSLKAEINQYYYR
ncbi:LINE-1 retrotransposable element ORF2 protein [Cucumis melo var. makuwa]|uniref:LINE-1 retrotransposable element ORF2 protein n=1 Tax=Cucumis melo var. makuwa TaxID=1194695 RepID=A0A5D3C1E9_CUCMM|nr:LINE-1 retrotransposable element ORF2 protein [Cucumis melo var. makuwa]